jgi:hypothetical protein
MRLQDLSRFFRGTRKPLAEQKPILEWTDPVGAIAVALPGSRPYSKGNNRRKAIRRTMAIARAKVIRDEKKRLGRRLSAAEMHSAAQFSRMLADQKGRDGIQRLIRAPERQPA